MKTYTLTAEEIDEAMKYLPTKEEIELEELALKRFEEKADFLFREFENAVIFESREYCINFNFKKWLEKKINE